MNNIKMSVRLVMAFVLVALLGAGVSLFAIRNMSALDDTDTTLYEQEIVGLSLAKEANVQRYAWAVGLRDAMLATTPEARAAAIKRMNDWRAWSHELSALAREKAQDDPQLQAAFKKLDELWKADQQASEGLMKLLAEAPLQAAHRCWPTCAIRWCSPGYLR
ncbi:MAG: MCP four helix bundle domain-containing protein [Phenylobacterium sp.]|uniref:MCP four helix bundle domain-containing protein n=1 Tax=Phenylobacterium sp. TaxID=1871053 RepID=UPI00273342F9|nr:MCP four helix bundle domain-containing protein [Phenylobacterium sp.]MDP3176028.1 MCP four helix bundle domain-containing protein [Phenylobacterium sp.]